MPVIFGKHGDKRVIEFMNTSIYDGQKRRHKVVVSGAAGIPIAPDPEVVFLIMQLWAKNDFQDREIKIDSYRSFLIKLKRKYSEDNVNQIIDVLEFLCGITCSIVYEVYDKNKRSWHLPLSTMSSFFSDYKSRYSVKVDGGALITVGAELYRSARFSVIKKEMFIKKPSEL